MNSFGSFSEDSNALQPYNRSFSGFDRVHRSSLSSLRFKFGVDSAWSLLTSLLVDELVDEQRIEYLERCWAQDNPSRDSKSRSNQFKQLWSLMFC
jgi:hypothetical protein